MDIFKKIIKGEDESKWCIVKEGIKTGELKEACKYTNLKFAKNVHTQIKKGEEKKDNLVIDVRFWINLTKHLVEDYKKDNENEKYIIDNSNKIIDKNCEDKSKEDRDINNPLLQYTDCLKSVVEWIRTNYSYNNKVCLYDPPECKENIVKEKKTQLDVIKKIEPSTHWRNVRKKLMGR